jgi:hypothetical protein
MRQVLRKIIISIYVLLFSYPVWGLIWLIGRTGSLKTLFLMYPTDKREYSDILPNIQYIINFMSGRPIPAGFIFDGWKPVGVYLCITDLPQDLMKKKNRHIAESINQRMRRALKISGARACGFAGQLGPILERRHGIAMKPPFFSGLQGTIFGADNSISYLAKKTDKPPWQLSIAILGGGELGGMFRDHFVSRGYAVDIVKMTFKRRGGSQITTPEEASEQLSNVDFVINLLPTGDVFLASGVPELLTPQATVIDFARPAINPGTIAAKVVMGNRIRRPGMRFGGALPGDWEQTKFPACSLSSILAPNYNVAVEDNTKFCDSAKNYSFQTALAPLPVATAAPLGERIKVAVSSTIME